MSTQSASTSEDLGEAGAVSAARELNRVNRLRAAARASEADGRLNRAEFFWAESCAELVRGAGTSSEVVGGAHHTRDREPAAPLQTPAREAAMEHLAYFDVWQARRPKHAAQHLLHARVAADVAHWSPLERAPYLGARRLAMIDLSLERSRFSDARREAHDLLAEIPDFEPYCATLANVHERAALAPTGSARRRRLALKRELAALHTLRAANRGSLAVYAAIARLSLEQARDLEAQGKIAEALLQVEVALAHDPRLTAAAAVRARLEANMQTLRSQSASESDATNQPHGRKARLHREQLAQGFRLSEAYRTSDDARVLARDVEAAHARALWLHLALGPLEAHEPRPRALEDAIATVLQGPPGDLDAVRSRFVEVSRDTRELDGIDVESVCRYIVQRWQSGAFDPALLTTGPLQPLSITAPRVGEPRWSVEPLWPWLTSRRDLRIKLQLVAACVAVLFAVVQGQHEWRARAQRDRAYEALLSARARRDFTGMLAASEVFLSADVSARDLRLSSVEGLYSEALVRWFLAEPAQESVQRARLQRYRALSAQSSGTSNGKGSRE